MAGAAGARFSDGPCDHVSTQSTQPRPKLVQNGLRLNFPPVVLEKNYEVKMQTKIRLFDFLKSNLAGYVWPT